jgi:flagellar biogenesis protein FliO
MIRLLVTLSLLASTASAATPPVSEAAPRLAAGPDVHDTLFPRPSPPTAPASSLAPELAPPEAAILAPPATPGLASALPALGVIAALAGVAMYLSRRRPGSGRRLVQVLETASLGPRRQLVVVRLGDDVLLLGSSEAGVTLLSTKPAGAGLGAPAAPAAPRPVEPAEERRPGVLIGLWSRLRERTPVPAKPTFEDLLLESTDDQALRRKLASGRPGRVA